MTLEEVAASLPNGFHDAYIKGISTDYVTGTASFDLEIWVGDDSAEKEEDREVYRPARLNFRTFCSASLNHQTRIILTMTKNHCG